MIETLVAMSLLSILLVFFFGIFRELAFIQDEDQQDYKKTFYENYSQIRLNHLFSHIYNENGVNNQSLFDFYMKNPDNHSTSPSLVVVYNNGVRQNPFLSGHIIGRLYVDDDKKELRLANWPMNLHNPHPYFFRETLIPNVESMRFEFLSSTETNSIAEKKKAEINKRGEWQNTWERSYEEVPLIVRVYLKFKDISEEKIYTFVIPTHRYGITYPGVI